MRSDWMNCEAFFLTEALLAFSMNGIFNHSLFAFFLLAFLRYLEEVLSSYT